MKTIFHVGVMLLFCLRLNAQVQELEQLKLDIEKLAQFKLIVSQMKQGYQVLQNGYNSVRDAAKGNFDLHKNYLDGLLAVSDGLKKSPAVSAVRNNQLQMQQTYSRWIAQVKKTNALTAPEIKSIDSVYAVILSDAAGDLDQLGLILQPGALRMSDAERISSIAQIRSRSDQQLGAVQQLIREKTALIVSRLRDQKDIEAIKKMYGLH